MHTNRKPAVSLFRHTALRHWTLAACAMLASGSAFADDFASQSGAACTFFKNINTILNLVSISVVTIAIIFAGYQIAFAHKRIADVAPILIGGMLIGAAGQIAKMLIPKGGDCGSAMIQVLHVFIA